MRFSSGPINESTHLGVPHVQENQVVQVHHECPEDLEDPALPSQQLELELHQGHQEGLEVKC